MSYTEPPFAYLETYRDFQIYYDPTHSTSADYRGYNPNTYQKPDGTYFGATTVAGVTLADARVAIDKWYQMYFPSEQQTTTPKSNYLPIVILAIIVILLLGLGIFGKKKKKI
jgi:hypothetical protein